MRKKKKTVLARASLIMTTIPRDLYYQTSGVFGIGMMLMLLAAALPTAVYFHHRTPLAAPSQAHPPLIKAHMQQTGAHKTVA